jgi:uncharacterized protein (TIGR00299 family) protein
VIAYLDCSTGVSGDKFLGALLDAGRVGDRFGEGHVVALLSALAPEARVSVSRVTSRGVGGLSVTATSAGEPSDQTWGSIRRLLESAELAPRVRDDSLRVFQALAKAEARAHATAPDDVHFHEVGAIDSILDVVGVCAGLEALEVERLVASPVAVGAGTVDTSHGLLGVPTPATSLLLLGVPITAGPSRHDGAQIGELTTPTGAALLAGLSAEFGPCPPITPVAVGFGVGARDIGSPNICRLIVGEAVSVATTTAAATVALLETNLDHIAPEEASFVAEQLLAEGALDAWLAPVVMKKGRAAVLLSVLCDPENAELTAERIVALSGTLGVRRTHIERYEAERESSQVVTPWGLVRVKVGPVGAVHRVRPEHDDVARIASERSLPYGVVRDELARLAECEPEQPGDR